jgi:hypothetical protein
VPRRSRPVSTGELTRARNAATRFLDGYLPFIYGRGSAGSVDVIAPPLRVQLTRVREEVTPAERRRHPRVVSLVATGQVRGIAQATALIDDGGVTTYALRLSLLEERSGWLVSAVEGG